MLPLAKWKHSTLSTLSLGGGEGEHNEKAEKCENKSKIQMANEMRRRRRHCHGNGASQEKLLFLSLPPVCGCKQKAISTCTIATLHVRCCLLLLCNLSLEEVQQSGIKNLCACDVPPPCSTTTTMMMMMMMTPSG